MTDKLYEALRFVAEILLPAVATLYAALAAVWGFALSDEIVGTIAAVDAFLGAFVAYSRAKYNGGDKH